MLFTLFAETFLKTTNNNYTKQYHRFPIFA